MTTGSTPLTHFSLFSGIGGLDLAAEWAGFQTVGQVEKGDYANKILKKHWPDVPKWRDIKDVTSESVRRSGIKHAPTILSGGFPCQPFSTAGKRRGTEDDRHLWPEMLRVVQELRPSWVVGENVAGFVSMALDGVCADLESAGYSCRAFLLPAASVGAPHIRDRIFVVANDDSSRPNRSHLLVRQGRQNKTQADARGSRSGMANTESELFDRDVYSRRGGHGLTDGCLDVSDANGINADGSGHGASKVCRQRSEPSELWDADPFGGLWSAEPAVGRVVARLPPGVDRLDLDRHAYGVPPARNRTLRLRCLGNAVVPQQVFPIFQAIASIEATYHSSPEE